MEEKDIGNFVTDIQEAQKAQSGRTDNIERIIEGSKAKIAGLTKECKVQSERIGIVETSQANMNEKIDGFIGEWKATFEESFERMDRLADKQQKQLRTFPKNLEVEIRHRFDGRIKIVVLTIAVSAITTAISLGLCSRTYLENKRLKENDLKYRFLQIVEPSATLNSDTLYSNDFKRFEQFIKQQEAQKQALEAAEAIARQQEQAAKEAKEQVEKLREPKAEKSQK
jgi:hypothetical protein